MVTAAGLLLLGFVLLLKGADWLVDGSSSIAMRAGISQLIIGLTLVSFGTSLPELFINIASRLGGKADITIGDILGSNVANILLVLGLSAAVRPLIFKKSTMTVEIPFALAAALALAFLLGGHGTVGTEPFLGLTRQGGSILLILFALFLFYVVRLHRSGAAGELELLEHPPAMGRSVLMVLAGVPSLAFGAKWVVGGASAIASSCGVPEAAVGLTVVAVGTSLPELATSLVASFKKHSDIAVGNIVGSNIFNICWILGISSLIRPLHIPRTYYFDIGAVIGATALLFFSTVCGKRGVLGRLCGIFFVFLYILYVITLVFRSPGMLSVH